ncbi:cytochrome P450 [Mariniblastus sp.]|nr:cytochrome P450 [Mariniblastus sp.]
MSDLIKLPLDLNTREFHDNRQAHYKWLREKQPVCEASVGIMKVFVLSRHEDCLNILKDDRFVRDTGDGFPIPVPLPKSIKLMMKSMINTDGDQHRRLRNLVHKAFTPNQLNLLEVRIERLTHDLLKVMESSSIRSARSGQNELDLMKAYSLPIPVTVIAEMVGVDPADVPKFASYIDKLTSGFTKLKTLKTMFWDMPKISKFVRQLINEKRKHPGDDILTGLIEAQEEGDRLTEDELVAMVFLLIIAGHETTVHLISNSVVTLLDHPEALNRLKAEPDLWESAVEELLRYSGPVLATKPMFAIEDVVLHGVTIPKGKAVLPLLGAGNFDPEVFGNPEQFDITRSSNKHLGFGKGIHYCLGAPLARMETKIALRNLFERFPDLKLAVPKDHLKRQLMPGWNRYQKVPVVFG